MIHKRPSWLTTQMDRCGSTPANGWSSKGRVEMRTSVQACGSSMNDSHSRRRLFWSRRGNIWVVIPFAILIAIIVAMLGINLIPDILTKRRLLSKLEEWQGKGLAIDRSTEPDAIETNTPSEISAEWRSIQETIGWGRIFSSVRVLRVYERQKELSLLSDLTTWDVDLPPEKTVSEYLDEMRPLIERLLAMRGETPMRKRGYSRVAENDPSFGIESYLLRQLLFLEGTFAAYKGDGDRCLRALQAMDYLIQSIEARGGIDKYLAYASLNKIKFLIIAFALAQELWTEEQVDFVDGQYLKQSVPPEKLRQRARSFVEYETSRIRSFVHSSESSQTRQLHRPFLSDMLTSAERVDVLLSQEFESPEPVASFQCLISDILKQTNPHSELDSNYQSIQFLKNFAVELVCEENLRRLARCAVGIKKYARQHQRLPTQLDDLLDQQLTSSDIHFVHRSKFGYAIIGEQAKLFARWSDLSKPPCSMESGFWSNLENGIVELNFR